MDALSLKNAWEGELELGCKWEGWLVVMGVCLSIYM